jgi:NADH:ubiquinone oxidoreductase subunit E
MCELKQEAEQKNERITNFYELEKMIDLYWVGRKDCLIQILHAAQSIYGYLPIELQEFICDKMNIPLPEISGVISFYSFFSVKQRGKHIIRTCLGTACYVRGGKKVLDHLMKKLDVEIGDTTEDGKFTLEIARCIGACGLAPAIMIDNEVYKQMTPSKIDALLKEF